MSIDSYILLLQPQCMRLFHKGQSHDAFVDIEYKGHKIIDLGFDVVGNDILIEDERNPSNINNFTNPIQVLLSEESSKSEKTNSLNLLTSSFLKVLNEYHSTSGSNLMFSSAIARSNLCVLFDLGIEPACINEIKSRFKKEPFSGITFHVTSEEYFNSIPESSKPQISIKSVGSDLFYFYKKGSAVKKRFLKSVAFNPLVEVVAREIYDYIDQSNSHFNVDFSQEKKLFLREAQAIVNENKPISLGEIRLPDGRPYEYQIYLVRCRSKAENASETALIIREIVSIVGELGVNEKDLRVNYAGKNIDNSYFHSLFANNVAEVECLNVFHALALQIESAEEKLANLKVASTGSEVVDVVDDTPAGITKPTENKATVTNKKSNVPPAPSEKSRKGVAPLLPTPPGAGKKGRTRTPGTGRTSPPPPPPPPPKTKVKSVAPKPAATVTTKSSPKAVTPPLTTVKSAPPKEKPAKGKMMAPPPPPPPRAGTPPAPPKKRSSVSKLGKKMAPPPPPPPRKK